MRRLTTLLTVVLSLALVVGAVILAVEVAAAAAGADPVIVPWHGAYDAGLRDAWDSSAARVVCAAVLAVGVLLLAAQLAPRHPVTLALADDDPKNAAGITPAEIVVVLRAAALTLEDIGSATVTVTHRRATVHATTNLREDDRVHALEEALTEAVSARLSTLQLADPPGVRAHLERALTRRDEAA